MKKSYVIAAANENFGIGKEEEIPWDVPGDFQFFKSMTYGCTVVVGRKTFENIGMLPGRRFVVLTSDETKEGAGPQRDENGRIRSVEYAHSFEQAFAKCLNRELPIWIAGGQSLYEHYVGKSKDVFLSRISGTHNCDKFFPKEKFENCYEPVSRVPAKGFEMTRYTKI